MTLLDIILFSVALIIVISCFFVLHHIFKSCREDKRRAEQLGSLTRERLMLCTCRGHCRSASTLGPGEICALRVKPPWLTHKIKPTENESP